jgi:DNA-binding HxlR family transcriptional regulator
MTTLSRVLVSRQKRRKGNVYSEDCPSRGILNHVTSRWGCLVILVLLDGTQRFNELARGIGGVSEKMLAQTLQTLAADGFLLRTVHPTIPPKVEYSLTPLGREVGAHIKILTDWVEDHVADVLAHRSISVRKKAS